MHRFILNILQSTTIYHNRTTVLRIMNLAPMIPQRTLAEKAKLSTPQAPLTHIRSPLPKRHFPNTSTFSNPLFHTNPLYKNAPLITPTQITPSFILPTNQIQKRTFLNLSENIKKPDLFKLLLILALLSLLYTYKTHPNSPGNKSSDQYRWREVFNTIKHHNKHIYQHLKEPTLDSLISAAHGQKGKYNAILDGIGTYGLPPPYPFIKANALEKFLDSNKEFIVIFKNAVERTKLKGKAEIKELERVNNAGLAAAKQNFPAIETAPLSIFPEEKHFGSPRTAYNYSGPDYLHNNPKSINAKLERTKESFLRQLAKQISKAKFINDIDNFVGWYNSACLDYEKAVDILSLKYKFSEDAQKKQDTRNEFIQLSNLTQKLLKERLDQHYKFFAESCDEILKYLETTSALFEGKLNRMQTSLENESKQADDNSDTNNAQSSTL